MDFKNPEGESLLHESLIRTRPLMPSANAGQLASEAKYIHIERRMTHKMHIKHQALNKL